MKIQALSRCTVSNPPKESLISNKILGPDQGWVLLSDEELTSFCSNAGKRLEHRGKTHYTHVCAKYSEWAFDAQDASYIRCVAFLHYYIPPKLRHALGEVDPKSGAKLFTFSGAQLLDTYRRVKRDEREAHVWKRDGQGEIAIDFCLTSSDALEENDEPRIALPNFIPPKKPK